MSAEAAAITIGKEVAKPASGFIDALLAPKIARVRAWAAEKDLKGRVAEDKLAMTFDGYFRGLLKKVSIVKTLVFPEQSFPLAALYEPLVLEEIIIRDLIKLKGSSFAAAKRSPPISEISLTRPGRRVFIVDDAGMGKSTFARHLILDEMASRDRIPLFLELRHLRPGLSVIEALASELDEMGRKFDRDVFNYLLVKGRFLAVLDGLDEVLPEHRAEVCAEIEQFAVKAERCALIITSRPEVPLPRLADSSSYSFLPLTEDQAKSLVLRYDEAAKIDVGSRLLNQIELLPSHFLKKPILVSLLYRSFGYNGEVSTNVATFYDELYAALYKGHDLTKGGFARPKLSGLDLDGFRRLVRGFAFHLIAKPPEGMLVESSALEMIRQAEIISGIKPKSLDFFLNDLLLAVPLLVRDGAEIRFAHKTIGEYFAAEYISYSPRGASFLEGAVSKGGERFYEVVRFVKNINPSLFRRTIVKKIANEYLGMAELYPDEMIRTLILICERSYLTVKRFGDKINRGDVESLNIHATYGQKNKYKVVFSLCSKYLVDLFIDDIGERRKDKSQKPDFKCFKVGKLDEIILFSDVRLHKGRAGEQMRRISPDMLRISALRGRDTHSREHPSYCVITEEKARNFLARLEEEDTASSFLFDVIS